MPSYWKIWLHKAQLLRDCCPGQRYVLAKDEHSSSLEDITLVEQIFKCQMHIMQLQENSIADTVSNLE